MRVMLDVALSVAACELCDYLHISVLYSFVLLAYKIIGFIEGKNS